MLFPKVNKIKGQTELDEASRLINDMKTVYQCQFRVLDIPSHFWIALPRFWKKDVPGFVHDTHTDWPSKEYTGTVGISLDMLRLIHSKEFS